MQRLPDRNVPRPQEGTAVSFVNRSTGFFIAPHVNITVGQSLGETDSRIQRLEIYPHQNSTVKSAQKLTVEAPDFVIRTVPEYHNPYCYVKDDFGVIILKTKTYPPGLTITSIGRVRIIRMLQKTGNLFALQGTPRVVGIHVSGNAASCGAKPENRPYGSAVLITPRVFETVNNWIMENEKRENGMVRVSTRRNFLRKASLTALSTSPLLVAPERKKELLVHHVFFYLKDPQSAPDEAKLLEGLEKLAKISTIQLSHIGRPARTSGEEIEKGYAVSWLCFFKNLIEEEIYQTDPIHLKFLEDNAHLWEKRVVYDALGKKG